MAFDGTHRPRPDGSLLADLIAAIHSQLGTPVLVDVRLMPVWLAYGTNLP